MNSNLLISSLQSFTYSYDVLVVFTRSLLFYTSIILSYPIDEWIHITIVWMKSTSPLIEQILSIFSWFHVLSLWYHPFSSSWIQLLSEMIYILHWISFQLFQSRWWLEHIYSHFDIPCSYTPFSFVEYLNRIESNDITSTIECIHNSNTQY